MKPKWQKLASRPGNMHTLVSVLWCGLCFPFKNILHILHRDMSDMLTASVDKLWTIFTKHLSDLMHARIPAKTLKGRKMKKLWIDRKVRTAIRKKGRLYTRMKKT